MTYSIKTAAVLIAACVIAALPQIGDIPAYAAQNSGAIGQIAPNGGIVALAGPVGAVVRALRVHPGDNVKAGDVLMTLDSESLRAELELASADVQGAKKVAASQIAAQNLAIDLAKQRATDAKTELENYRMLGPRASSPTELARLTSLEAQARVGVQIEQAKLDSVRSDADKATKTAEKRLALANAAIDIRATADGTILKIDRRVGQRLTGEAAIQMGDLRTMYVTCQIFQGDLLSLKPGMKATIRNASLAEPLAGTVEEVSRLVDTRSRLGDVRIRLDKVDPANRLVGMEVEVVIAR